MGEPRPPVIARYHPPMRILLTNDDGIDAPGIRALHEAVRGMGDVTVVAPAEVQSAMGHAVTFHRAIRCAEWRCDAGTDYCGLAVHGRPADCVKLAVNHLLTDPPDLVLSGMNAGANIGINVIYSGTVAAAMEAAFYGIPAIAVSLHIGRPDRTRWRDAASHARRAIGRVLSGPMRPHTVMNVNIPILDDGVEPLGIKVVPISTSPLTDRYESSEDPSGDRHFQAMSGLRFRHTPPDSDVAALFARYITVTPLHFDLTQRDRLGEWEAHVAEGDVTASTRG
jgi:5'-nucleotidase